jgi:hypothetical protein
MRHDWVLATAIPITDAEVKRCLAGEVIKLTDVTSDNARGTTIGCYACEMHPQEAAAECPGQPTERDQYGNPIAWQRS